MCEGWFFDSRRPLRNSRQSLLGPSLRGVRRQSWSFFLQVQDIFTPLEAFASQQRHVSSTIDLEDRFFQIEGHGIEQELQFNLGPPEVSGSKEAVATLEGAEGALHL